MNARKATLRILVAALCANVVILADPKPAYAGQKTGTLDAPFVSCASGSGTSIDLTVTAGASGAPAGFTIQWMTIEDYALYGWPGASSLAPSYCDASFSGNASDSNHDLAPNGSETVRIGELVLDHGVSTSCSFALDCGRTYVFRAFVHATSSMHRSDFSPSTSCPTRGDLCDVPPDPGPDL